MGNQERAHRRRITPHVWRVAGTCPVVLVGEGGQVRGLAAEMEEKLQEKIILSVDIWIRTRPGVAGQHNKLEKRLMIVMHAAGDIERNRVCVAGGLACSSSVLHPSVRL